MGTKNNVNPDHYKERGRERPGQDIVQEIHKQQYAQAQNKDGGSEFIPGTQPVNEKPVPAGDGTTGQIKESANSSSSDS
jgi:hypothetical protein